MTASAFPPSPTYKILPAPSETPYAGLSPDIVLDALDAVGMRGDGRLIQLNSYENRCTRSSSKTGG